MFSGIEQLAMLVAHVALCLADPRRHDAGRGAREVGGDLELMREVDRVASQLGGGHLGDNDVGTHHRGRMQSAQ